MKVLSDIYAAVDSQQVVLLGLLDLSATFDCVDHEVLLRRLRVRFGIRRTAHDWIASFLYGRSQRVLYRGRLAVCRVVAAAWRSPGLSFGPYTVPAVYG